MFGRKPQPRPLPPAGFHEQLPAKPVTIDHESQLSRAQLQTIDWSEPDAPALPAKRPVTYVPSASEIMQVPNVTMASPDVSVTADILPAATVEAKTLGSQNDRARAWIRYAMPLCLFFAFGVTVAAIALQAVPLVSAWVLVWFTTTFALVYAPTMVLYWLITPEGVALLHTLKLWGFLYRGQSHRHEIEREWHKAQMDANRKRLGGGK